MDRNDIQVVVFDGRPADPRLREWMNTFPHRQYASHIAPKGYPDLVAMQRNRVCRWFLDRTKLDYLLLLDSDMIPIEATEPIKTAEAPIAGCCYIQNGGVIGHEEDGALSAGCLRISRTALEAIETPWFDWELTKDGCGVQACDCGHFCARAREAGYFPKTVGRIDHAMLMRVSINDDDTFRTSLLHEDSHGKK